MPTPEPPDKTPSLSPSRILELTEAYPLRELEPGAVLIEAGVHGHPLYVLTAGRLEVRFEGRALSTISQPGVFVGELGLLLRTAANADVVAISHTSVRRIDDGDRFLEARPEVMRYVAEMLAARLRRMTTYLADLQVQFAGEAGTLGLVGEVLENLLHSGRPTVEPGSEREPDAPY